MPDAIEMISTLNNKDLYQALGTIIFGPIDQIAEEKNMTTSSIAILYQLEFMNYKKSIISVINTANPNQKSKAIVLQREISPVFQKSHYANRKKLIKVPDTITHDDDIIIISEPGGLIKVESIANFYTVNTLSTSFHPPKYEFYSFSNQDDSRSSPYFCTKIDNHYTPYQIDKKQQYFNINACLQFDYNKTANLTLDSKGSLIKSHQLCAMPQYIHFGDGHHAQFMMLDLAFNQQGHSGQILRTRCKTNFSCIPAKKILTAIAEKK